MTFNFTLQLYLTQFNNYEFAYPVDSNDQSWKLRQNLDMTKEDFEDWEPDWKKLQMYNRTSFLKQLGEDNFVVTMESYPCREVAVAKGFYYAHLRSTFHTFYKNSYLVLSYPDQIPTPFHNVVRQALLTPRGVESDTVSITCDLDDSKFVTAMNPGHWNTAWVSLLTYFAKYGEFLLELAQNRYGTKDIYSLDETVEVILDSWSGQVGFYTAYGLHRWASKDENAMYMNTVSFSGIHSAMVNYSTLYNPASLFQFAKLYDTGMEGACRMFVDNFHERIEEHEMRIPHWYKKGGNNNGSLSESPEWNDFMEYDNEDEIGEDDDSNYDFGEDW